METISVAQMKQLLLRVSTEIIDNEPYLTKADTIIGDGDHGFGMKRGFSAVYALLSSNDFSTMPELFKAVGIEIVKTMGGASGVIFGTLFISGLDICGNEQITARQLTAFFQKGLEGILRRGKASAGSKTMLDALIPAVNAMNSAVNSISDIHLILKAGYDGACEGVEATKSMRSRAGRSKNFQVTIGHPDPGAISLSLIFKALYESSEFL
ncbi:dihydroxyacetone kinase subunit L [Spirochaetia bacterium]|nr:dihydroxyacetone kinase subunit L [Spirochaetia bacterium]